VLLQWRKPITIALTPESITINSGNKAIHTINVDETATEKSSWSQVLTELESYAATIAANKVKFVISNNYVRYAILPWQTDVFSKNDWQSLAENNLREHYGNIVDNWQVTVAMQGYGKPMIISAIDQLLINRIDTLAKQFNWTVESIEPALMSVTNQYRNKINNTSFMLMTEQQRVLVAEIDKGCLVGFSVTSPLIGQEQNESNKLIKRILKMHSAGSSFIHYFGDQGLQANSDLESAKVIPLAINPEGSAMSIMLAKS